MKRTLFVAVALCAATMTPVRAAEPASIKDKARVAVAACATDDAVCKAGALDRVVDAAFSEAMPSGRQGPAAWLRQVADLQGLRAVPATVPVTSLEEAVFAYYRESGITLTAAQERDARSTIAALSPSTHIAVARLVNAMRVADRLSREATVHADLSSVGDWAMAMKTITFAPSLRGTFGDAARAERARLLGMLERVDLAKLATAAAVVADALSAYQGVEEDTDLPFIFVGGDGDNEHTETRAILIDQGGNDIYRNNAGGGLFAIAGGSVAADLGSGNDIYVGDAGVQGSSTGAVGLLYDEGGADIYQARQFSQGQGVAGVGILYDAGEGNDSFTSPGEDPISTKASTLGGIGILIDEGGDDYLRQDGLDGFDYAAAGGIALLANLGTGNDTYRTEELHQELCVGDVCEDLGTFAGPVQMSSEVNATAILIEEGGDDEYYCGPRVRQGCQSAAGAGSFQLLLERGGNDKYMMGTSISADFLMGLAPIDQPSFPMGQGAGYEIACIPCPPPSIALLRDEGGSDFYQAEKWAQGYGTFGALGVLYDSGSAIDEYDSRAPFLGARFDNQSWLDGALGVGLDE